MTPASTKSDHEVLLESPRDPLELRVYQDREKAAEPGEECYNVHKLPLDHEESKMYVNVSRSTDSVCDIDDYEPVDGLLKERSVATPNQERKSPMNDHDEYVEMKPGGDGDSSEDKPTDEYVEMAPRHDTESGDGPDDVYTEIVSCEEVGSYVEMQPHILPRPGNPDARGYVNVDYTKEVDCSTSSSAPTSSRRTRLSTGTPTKIKTTTKRDKAMTELFFPSSPVVSGSGEVTTSEAKPPPMPDNMPVTDGGDGERADGEGRDKEADDTGKEVLYQNVEEWTSR